MNLTTTNAFDETTLDQIFGTTLANPLAPTFTFDFFNVTFEQNSIRSCELAVGTAEITVNHSNNHCADEIDVLETYTIYTDEFSRH